MNSLYWLRWGEKGKDAYSILLPRLMMHHHVKTVYRT